jgi:hypothetical protein
MGWLYLSRASRMVQEYTDVIDLGWELVILRQLATSISGRTKDRVP